MKSLRNPVRAWHRARRLAVVCPAIAWSCCFVGCRVSEDTRRLDRHDASPAVFTSLLAGTELQTQVPADSRGVDGATRKWLAHVRDSVILREEMEQRANAGQVMSVVGVEVIGYVDLDVSIPSSAVARGSVVLVLHHLSGYEFGSCVFRDPQFCSSRFSISAGMPDPVLIVLSAFPIEATAGSAPSHRWVQQFQEEGRIPAWVGLFRVVVDENGALTVRYLGRK